MSQLSLMRTRPAISVGMPCYNSERWLEQAVDSLLAQTFGDFELIVCDNASIDSTWEILQRYARVDSRVRAHRNAENLGASANYNRVFELATGPYFKWASSNDWCAPVFLQVCYDALESDEGAVAACPRAALFDTRIDEAQPYAHGLDLRQDDAVERFIGALAIRRNITMNGLMRSTALRKTEMVRPYYGSDCVMVAALAMQGKLLEIPQTLLFMNDTPSTATWKMPAPEVRRHFTGSTRAMTHQSARNWFGYWRAVRSAPLTKSQRLRLSRYLLKTLRWGAGDIAREALEALARDQRDRAARSRGDA